MLSKILCAARMFPMQPTREPAGAAARRFNRTEAAVRNGPLQEVARCKEGPVLVFWPPTRGTHWPSGGRAVVALRASEEEEGGGSLQLVHGSIPRGLLSSLATGAAYIFSCLLLRNAG